MFRKILLGSFIFCSIATTGWSHDGPKGDNVTHVHGYLVKELPNTLPREGRKKNRSKNNLSSSHVKHRISQYANIAYRNETVLIESIIMNKDRARGRTMCSEVQLKSRNGSVLGISTYRMGIKRRGNHTRFRMFRHSIPVPRVDDFSGLRVEVHDWYCPKGFTSRFESTVRKTVLAPVKAAAKVGVQAFTLVGSAKDKILDETSRGMRKIGGTGLQKAFDDVAAVTRFVDDKTAIAAINGVEQFAKTGRVRHLDPISILVSGQIASAEQVLYGRSTPIPGQVFKYLPAEMSDLFVDVRYIEKKRVPELSIAHFNLGNANATTMGKVIVFRDGAVPSVSSQRDIHLWLHELFHVAQYKRMGFDRFSQVYVREVFKTAQGKQSINDLEREADLFACRFMPITNPSYIGTCP